MKDEDVEERAAMLEFWGNVDHDQVERLAVQLVARERAQEPERRRLWKQAETRERKLWT
jgi:hypothetical protein